MLKRWQLVLVILVLALVIVPTVKNNDQPPLNISNAISNQNQQISSYEPHSPIIINSDLDFESQEWPGNGSESNPYLIEGLSIITDGTECINISNTDVFFVIKDCLISSLNPWDKLYNRGVTFGNVTHGTIKNLVVSKKWIAITIVSSSNCSVIESQIYDNCHGVEIRGLYDKEYPGNCSIFNNTLFDNHVGVMLTYVRHCLVDSNDILGDIHLQETVECKVSNNIIEGSQTGDWYYYLSFFDVIDTLVVNNTMIDSGLEFNYLHRPSLQLYNNTVNDKPIGYFTNLTDSIICPSDYGQVFLIDCINVTVRDGTIHNTAESVSFYSCRNCVIENCTVYSSGFGATLCWSDHCSVILSDFHDNKHWGIDIVESSNTIVAGNILYENKGIGIFVPPTDSFNNSFYYNVICSNGDGSTISDGNAWEDGHNNVWDDGVSLGNFWDDYGGIGDYHIPGDALSVDRYPSRVESVIESDLWIGFNLNPSEPTGNESVLVRVGVIDADGVDEVILSYSIDGNLTWTNITMVQSGPIWNTTIPSQSENTTVSYRVFVRDNAGNIESSAILVYGAPSNGTNTTTNGQDEGNSTIYMAIAIGGTIVVAALALILSRRRY